MPELSAYLLLSVLLISFEDGYVNRAEGGLVSPGPTPPLEDNASAAGTDGSVSRQTLQPQEHQVHTSPLVPAPPLALRVWVKDASSQRFIGGASVEVFVNGTQAVSAVTQDNGEVLLRVPYALGQTLSIVASMDGYVHKQLPWKTTKMPIFSSVTLALLPQTQGNIWLFDDSVLITQKTSEYTSQPSVQFPKSLLELPDNTNISMVTAYLTVPPIDKDCHLCTTGLLSNRSGFRSVRLSPVAGLSTQLLADGKELPVSGPVKITVPLPHSAAAYWRASDSIPAWAFDRKTGTWLNKGLGTVKRDGDALIWTYVASHLGDWLVAPIPAFHGYMGHGAPSLDISYHTYLLMGSLGGTLLIAIGFLSVILCHCRHSARGRVRRRSSARVILQKDQTTSTSCDGEDDEYPHDDRTFSLATMAQRNASTTPRHQANYNIYVEDVGRSFKLYENVGSAGATEGNKSPMPSVYVNSEEVARLREMSDQNRPAQGAGENMMFKDKLFHIYNQPVALVPAPELFASHPPPTSQAEPSGCRSATFPRNGMEHGPQSERNLKDSFTQTLPKNATQDSDEQPVSEGAIQGAAINPGVWGRYSHLLESVSVPGTLNEAVGMGPFRAELQGISEQTLVELSKAKPSPHPPRAWFVSLDGKPAASVRHSVIEIQGRHRPGSSNDTSLDSGVDMNEHQQPLLKMEREGPSFPAMPRAGGPASQEEPDLSSSEIGSPEDGALRHTLESSNAAMPFSSISEERDVGDTSSESRGTPPPRRPRKVRDKGRPDKKSGRHVREERPQMKR
ncbi:protein FAM171B [Alosa sapidissima]|uniref:protein FAM171B n=1 Tax=Alosa sapidissima TaxID=34773 RepID=UPI001C08CB64|nr:protein FAM171B [Alosa sapidissima]